MKTNTGFSLVEMLIVVVLFSMIMAGILVTMTTARDTWANTDVRIQLKESLRLTAQRLSQELRQTGFDKDGVLQLSVFEGTAFNGSDAVRFSVPVCFCGGNIVDDNGDVINWGAPSSWGASDCPSSTTSYVIKDNGKVDICHLPPGNPENTQSLQVAPSAVPAHLAHGDYLGECGNCPVNYKYVEYRINSTNQLLRRVLDNAGTLLREDLFTQNISDFQASLSANQKVVTLTVTATRNTNLNRQITSTNSVDVYLRN
ncbi:MAG: hypothetical protein A2Y04_01665 [Omnitrophica WOR_2 bacterium GWC2_45_7]|nr:MAG: hypothetical protein A2Y04_01665 [Omnitrophica WOR_2 bacterium GWC2_45_7]